MVNGEGKASFVPGPQGERAHENVYSRNTICITPKNARGAPVTVTADTIGVKVFRRNVDGAVGTIVCTVTPSGVVQVQYTVNDASIAQVDVQITIRGIQIWHGVVPRAQPCPDCHRYCLGRLHD